VAHTPRDRVSKHDPRLVTLKLAKSLPRLRNLIANQTITSCIRGAQKPTFRIVHYSIQTNHMHLIVEADDRDSLACGMKGLGCRLARNLNKLWKRRGRVFPERFYDSVLRSPRQVHNALKYVLNNRLKYGGHTKFAGNAPQPDRYSSGRYFDGWLDAPTDFAPDLNGAPIVAACWKIKHGWKRRYRAFTVDAVPGR